MPIPPPEKRYAHLINQSFGSWMVVNFSYMKKFGGNGKKTGSKPIFTCRCSCGSIDEVCGSDLVNGKSSRCKECNYAKPNAPLPPRHLGSKNSSYRGTKDLAGSVLGRIQRQATARGIEWDVTYDYLQSVWDKQGGKCYFSGIKLMCPPKSQRKKFDGKVFSTLTTNASLDRLDSTKGYIEGNVAWVSGTVNVMKASMTEDTFLAVVETIYDHRCN